MVLHKKLGDVFLLTTDSIMKWCLTLVVLDMEREKQGSVHIAQRNLNANPSAFGAVCDANPVKILGSELPPASFAQIHSPNE